MKALTVAATMFLAASVALADDAETVLRLDREISVATWTADPVWFEENLAEDYVLITPSGAIKHKRDIVRELSAPNTRMDPFETSEVQLRMYGDAAVVTGRMTQKFVVGRVHYTNDVRYTDVYVKRKGRWLLVSAHASTMAGKR